MYSRWLTNMQYNGNRKISFILFFFNKTNQKQINRYSFQKKVLIQESISQFQSSRQVVLIDKITWINEIKKRNHRWFHEHKWHLTNQTIQILLSTYWIASNRVSHVFSGKIPLLNSSFGRYFPVLTRIPCPPIDWIPFTSFTTSSPII